MRIVILMGGVGTRFAVAGYEKPKPLIKVDGKTMVEHVVSMYPGTHEFIFVCNENFVDNDALRSLKKALPNSRIVSIPSHKLGPVYSLSLMWDELPDDEPVLVSYSDFNANWDFADFIRAVQASDCDGAVPCYTGFHPHLLHKNKYAGVIAGPGGKMEKIKEKYSFTEDPEDSFHSAGNYYFSKTTEMRRYGKALLKSGNTVQGEYHLSMIYYGYLADGKSVLVYPLKHFLQWGTPKDLEEYEAWSLFINGEHKGVTDIPDSRRTYVKISHQTSSEDYKRSFNYWKGYFSK